MTPLERPADLVLTGGRVLTMDAQRDAANEPAEAVAVRAGRIVAVGSGSDVERQVGSRTRRIELAGRTCCRPSRMRTSTR